MTPALVAFFVLLGFGLLYWYPIRRWYRHWGATDAEIKRTMPGDWEVPDPTYEVTLATLIDAPPSAIWPWLLQMGYRRGGLYSYDWLDRLFGFLDSPSAERILPEHQQLHVGDVIPVGRGDGFPVRIVDPLRALVLGGEATGSCGSGNSGCIRSADGGRGSSQRNRARLPKTIGWTLFMGLLEPAAFIMTRKMLLGLNRRAEATAAQRRDVGTDAA